VLRVHTSNYRVIGFVADVAIEELASLAHRYGLIAVDDLGSGALVDPQQHGLPNEPFIQASVLAGADLICCSGDKLLGGPQCGLILGRRALIDLLEADPMMRTYRVDKLTLLTLEATLRQYLDEEEALETVPTLRMLRATTQELAERARELLGRLQKALPDEHFYIGSDVTYAGGGSMPGQELETVVVQWRPAEVSAQEMATALRGAETPVIVRLRDDSICFDLRTIHESEFDAVVDGAYAAAYADSAVEDSDSRVSLPILDSQGTKARSH
jgi:L-seryl-tRNA(Ser) seleniumtransferase